MALIRRVSRLFAADIHAVLDQIEEPDIVLRQAIREMEEELARQRQRHQWLAAEIEAAVVSIESFAARTRDIDTKLDLCFASDNEPLARKLTRRKLEAAKLDEQADARRQALAKQLADLDALIAANADQLESMQQKAALVASDACGATARADVSGIDDDDVEIAFLREKQARTSS